MNTFSRAIRFDSMIIDKWVSSNKPHFLAVCIVITIVGTATYGVTIGLWRGSLQALYAAIKFPLLILITTASNSLLNWFISLMIGANFSLVQTLKYQFLSFAIAAIILLSFTPVSLFFLWNAPQLSGAATIGNGLITIMHVILISVAGSIANIRLYNLLRKNLNRMIACGVLFAWLAGNMFLGCQISWILRPFIGSPVLQIQFLRPNPLEGNFYIDVYDKLKTITTYKGDDNYE